LEDLEMLEKARWTQPERIQPLVAQLRRLTLSEEKRSMLERLDELEERRRKAAARKRKQREKGRAE
jgi:hypothetical protein